MTVVRLAPSDSQIFLGNQSFLREILSNFTAHWVPIWTALQNRPTSAIWQNEVEQKHKKWFENEFRKCRQLSRIMLELLITMDKLQYLIQMVNLPNRHIYIYIYILWHFIFQKSWNIFYFLIIYKREMFVCLCAISSPTVIDTGPKPYLNLNHSWSAWPGEDN